MNKRFFNQQNLTRRLRLLPVLFAMLLMPLSAWAQTITVAGVSPDAYGNFEGISGVHYEAVVIPDVSTSYTLTLNGATINGQISSDIAALKVHLVGENTITPGDGKEPFVYNNAANTNTGTLTFESSNSEAGELLMSGISEMGSIGSGYTVTNEFTLYGENGSRWIKEAYSDMINIYYNVYYGITVNGTSVSKYNKNAVMELSGTDVSYTPADNTLHVPDNPAVSDYEIQSHLSALNVSINGNCALKSIRFALNDEFPAQSGTLTIMKDETSANGVNKLTLRDANGVIRGFTSVTIEEPLVLRSPASTDALATASSAVISDYATGYNVIVAGVQVTDVNKGNVLNDAETPTVVFTPADNTVSPATPATLTLNGATINGKVRTNYANLTIELIGENTIEVNDTSALATWYAGTNLVFTTSETSPGSLTMKPGADFLAIDTYRGFNITYQNDLSLIPSTPTAGQTAVVGVSYGLTVGGVPVTSANASNILADIDYLNGKVSFTVEDDKNVLILGGTDGANLVEYDIVSDLTNLTIRFKGNCSLNTITSNKTNATLRFEKAADADDGTQLTGSGLGGSPWSGFGGGVTFGGNLAYFTNSDTWYINNLSSPKISVENSAVSFGVGFGNNIIPITNANDFNFFYTLQYEDENQQSVTTFTQYDPQNPLTINKASELRVKARYKDAEEFSDVSVGKYFGFATESVSGYAGQESIPFSLVPAINVATDGLTLGIQTDNVNIVAGVNDAYDAIILGNGVGLTYFRVTMEPGAETPYTILNYMSEGTANIGPLDVKVSVAEPTVSPDATGGPFNIGQLVTLGYKYEPSNDVHSIKYIVGEDLTVTPTTYTAPFAINESTAVNAWVETTYSGNKYSSDTVTVNYAIKQDPKLKVSYTWYRLRYGETFSQEVTSDMPTTPTVTWSSSNTDVATVDPTTGVVTPVAAYGSDIEITATFAGDDTWSAASVSYAIRVDKAEQYLRIKYKGTNIPLSTVKVEKGNPIDIKTEYDFSCPEELVGSLVWYSNDENVVTVTNGVITTVGCGSTWIKVSSAGNSNYESDYCDFTIEVAPPKPTINLAEGTYLSTHAPITITKENIANTTISYTWDDLTGNNDAEWKNYTDAGVTIQEGTLSARVGYYDAENYNTIYSDTVSVAYTVIIDPELQFIQNDEPVDAAVYTIGATNNLELPVLDNTYGVAVTYESSNTDVATVAADGTVTVVGIGTATITATSAVTSEYAAGEASYTLTVKRQLTVSFSASNEWATYCGTENLSTPEGLKAYQVTAVEGATVTISEIGYIPANTAVLLQNVSNNNVWTNIAASAYTGATSTFENNKLIGTASAVDVSTITGGTVYILVNNMFRRSTSGTIPANRGYLVVATSSNAPQLSISIGDENTTGVQTLNVERGTLNDDSWYTIDGRKLQQAPAQKGLYIKNGKKVFINKK